MERFKNNKKKIAAAGLILMIITVIIGIGILNNFKEMMSEVGKISDGQDPEILRSMTYPEVQPGEDAVAGTEFVKFDAFFTRDLTGSGYANKLRGSCRTVDQTDTLFISLGVLTEGSFEDGVITINGTNMKLQTAIIEDNIVANNLISQDAKQINLKTVYPGTQRIFSGITKANLQNNINNYSKTNSVTLTGTYVDNLDNRIPISKTVNFEIDWHGETTAQVRASAESPSSVTYDISEIEQLEGKVRLDFSLQVLETANQLLLKKQHIEVTVPNLNGYAPLLAAVGNVGLSYSYNPATQKLTIEQTATTDGGGNITSSVPRITYLEISLTYPAEAYENQENGDIMLEVPVSAYYEGYNNTNTEFQNPKKSNTATGNVYVLYRFRSGSGTDFEITVGEYIYSSSPYYKGNVVSKKLPLQIYNNPALATSGKDLYTVRWIVYMGDNGLEGLILEEDENKFIKNDTTTQDMSDYITNVGIYFQNAGAVLGTSGYIKVYDNDTNTLLHTFTNADWAKYTASTPYKYGYKVDNIRIETSSTEPNKNFVIYHVKEIDDEKLTGDYTELDFEELVQISSSFTATLITEEASTNRGVEGRGDYLAPESVVTITNIQPTYITTTEIAENMKIEFEVSQNNIKEEKWQDGIFVLKFPEEILDVEISNIVVNKAGITIQGYEIYEESGNIFLKIQTSNATENTYKITITADLAADAKVGTTGTIVEIYAHNAYNEIYPNSRRTEDIYDINQNGNITEYVGNHAMGLNIYAPSGLITAQTISDYNLGGDVTVSPKVAEIDKPDNDTTAQINVSIRSNYDKNISEVIILGKIPFTGNTSQILGEDLGSTFTSTMTGAGITLPPELVRNSNSILLRKRSCYKRHR